MILRRLASAAAAVSSLLVVASAAAAAGSVHLIEAGGARFPDRSYILSLPPGTRVSGADVQVRENGALVSDVSALAADAAQQRNFAVVLAIDTSNSMRGKPIRAAVEAARAFAGHRNPNQQMAVVYFDRTIRVAERLTTNGARIAAALSHVPRLHEKTRLYDALDRSSQLLEAAGVKTGSVVLLSDGADVGSSASLAQVKQGLHDRHVRVFTVGLASSALNSSALTEIAGASGGTYVQADTASQLHTIYDSLGYKLSNEFLVTYRSLAGPGKRVVVSVTVAGVQGDFRGGYTTPSLNLNAPAEYHRSLVSRFVTSWLSMLVVTVAALGLILGALYNVVRPRESGVRTRVGSFISAPRAKTQQSPILSEELLQGADISLSRLWFWPGFRAAIEIAGIEMTPVHLAALTFLSSVLALFVFSLVGGPLLGIAAALLLPFSVYMYVKGRAERLRRQFAEQLPDNLEVLAAAMRAGHSLVGALSNVAEGAVEPSRSEFARIVADEQLGSPLEDAISVVVKRMENGDLDQVALIARLQRETGSSSAEVLDRVVETVRGRAELRRLVKTLTAQGRLSRWVLTLIPVVLALLLSILSPGYLNPMFDHALGRIALFFAAGMVVTGSLVIKKIVNIKV
ncbi:MAG: VWA domain-containing protein [Gaiellaceae bacterium]